jgi:hypothetical protein
MVRNFILNESQRREINEYLDALKAGKNIAMTPQIRQMRLRAKKLNYEEMMADLSLLGKLATLRIPKGRISSDLKGTFNVRQLTASGTEIKAHFEVRQPEPTGDILNAPHGTWIKEEDITPDMWKEAAEIEERFRAMAEESSKASPSVQQPQCEEKQDHS